MASIGELLKNARLEKGFSLKEVEDATKIRSKYLQAIEEDCYDRLPGEIYTKGFIRSYAKFLNINQNDELEPFIEALFSISSENELLLDEEMGLKDHNGKISNKQNRKINKKKAIRLLSILLISIVAFSAIISYWISQKSAPTNTEPTANIIQAHTFQVQMDDETTNDVEATVTDEQLILRIDIIDAKKNSVDKCWVSVYSDGMLLWEETLPEGTTREIVAKKEITIKVGNAGVCNITVNQQDLGKLGRIAQVVTKTYTLENIE